MAQPPSRSAAAGAHPEALESALLEALRDGVPVGTVERIDALIRDHAAGTTSAAIGTAKGLGRSRASGVADFRGSFFEFLSQRYLPMLVRAILDAAPVPCLDDAPAVASAEINVIEAAELLLVVTRVIERSGAPTDAALGIADAIVAAVDRFGAALAAALAGDRVPDMGRLTRELAKLELLRWLLQTLCVPDHHRTVSTQLQVAARRALRRATTTIERFLADRAVDARRATAAVTAEIEDLVTLVLLLLDTEREDAIAEADNAFFNALSAEEVAAFAAQATALAELMFDELDAMAGAAPRTDAFARALRQVMTLASFARRLDAYVTVDAVLRLGDTIARRRAALEARHGGPLRPLS